MSTDMIAAAQAQSVLDFVTCPGENTTEHAAQAALTTSAKVQKWLGLALAAVPQLLDMINALPDSIKQNKVPQICLAVLGGAMAIRAVVTETQAKVAYINGRALTKAKAVDLVAAPPAVASAAVTASPVPATVVTAPNSTTSTTAAPVFPSMGGAAQ